MYYKFSGFTQRLVGATAAAAYTPQVTARTRAEPRHRGRSVSREGSAAPTGTDRTGPRRDLGRDGARLCPAALEQLWDVPGVRAGN